MRPTFPGIGGNRLAPLDYRHPTDTQTPEQAKQQALETIACALVAIQNVLLDINAKIR